jgi:DnaJ-class molecular chaperone
MSKVDPMEIMLSDIFDKVFYSKDQEPRTKECEECVGEGVIQRDEGDIDLAIVPCDHCDGEGEVEIEVFMPQNFDRDVGYIDHKRVECDECYGTGEMEVEDD